MISTMTIMYIDRTFLKRRSRAYLQLHLTLEVSVRSGRGGGRVRVLRGADNQREEDMACRRRRWACCSERYPVAFLQESDKGQIFYWSIQTYSRIRLLIDWSIVTMLKKPQNCPISDFFDLTTKYFLPLLPYTDPVLPNTKQYRPKLTQYHHVSTITTLYWSSTTKYQQVSPPTDPVPSCIN